MSDLAKHAVTLDGWEWMLGMRSLAGRRVSYFSGPYPCGIVDGDFRVRPHSGPIVHDDLPDLEDAATLGCLLALVRKRHGEPGLHCRASTDLEYWEVVWKLDVPYDLYGCCKTEAEALVAALGADR